MACPLKRAGSGGEGQHGLPLEARWGGHVTTHLPT